MSLHRLLTLIEPPPPRTAEYGSTVLAVRTGLRAWAAEVGLVGSGSAGERVVGDGVESMAVRSFPTAPVERVTLFTKWLAWVLWEDDEIDEGGVGGTPSLVAQRYDSLLRALRAGVAGPDADGLERAAVALWQETIPEMGAAWRERFLTNLAGHADATLAAAHNQQRGRTPTPAEFPMLRGGLAGLHVYDLAEPVLGRELPEAVASSHEWRTLVGGVNDVAAWCNDIASLERETAGGEVHNYVIVIRHALGCSDEDAIAWVADRIADRLSEVATTQAALPALTRRLGLSDHDAHTVEADAKVICAVPRDQLEWLVGSQRYSTVAVGPVETATG
ncbi:terpene synthase family protein [Actinoalloteichus hymeniacidonis]|uniref:Terpene synthase family protein n=1 Tax=Actinoalloteichus hymeniacidonis TaxID=340345 RepID=A0AAC9HPA1_9PSEU|nr:terpene synthase family protein [Actinoalloteichus hymeniacidonis]AOS63072.1 terpene synthase family protein [Actinoalloteichus hymeniacidonis]MBB5908892.1 hypothetical protein [Actinoalloteichus hymeniacidonis]